MAERICRDALKKENIKGVKVSSAGLQCGTGFDMASPTREALSELGITAGVHKSQRVTAKLIKENDLIVTMTAVQKDIMTHNAYRISHNVHCVLSMTELIDKDIDDPFGSRISIYIKAAEQIKKAMPEIIRKIKELKNGKSKTAASEEEHRHNSGKKHTGKK